MVVPANIHSENLGFPLISSQDLARENGIGQFSQSLKNLQQWRNWEEQKRYQKQSTAMHIQNQNQCFPFIYTSSSAINDQIPQQFYQSIARHVETETSELDQFIDSQYKILKLALQDQINQRVLTIWKTLESKAMFLLEQKQEQIVHAAKRTMELQEFLRKLEREKQTWQRIAQEHESTIISLNNTLSQMRKAVSSCFPATAVQDAESCCDSNFKIVETENNGGRKWPAICQGCNSRKSCMVFLPCRHLCSCKACESILDSCPVCFTGKSASVEALFSQANLPTKAAVVEDGDVAGRKDRFLK